jgi:hypothetical protein
MYTGVMWLKIRISGGAVMKTAKNIQAPRKTYFLMAEHILAVQGQNYYYVTSLLMLDLFTTPALDFHFIIIRVCRGIQKFLRVFWKLQISLLDSSEPEIQYMFFPRTIYAYFTLIPR